MGFLFERVDILFYIVAVLIVLNLFMLITIIRLKSKYNKFIETSGKLNIEEVLIENQNQLADLEEFKEYFKKYEKTTNKRLKKTLSRVAIKKYNAFDGMGGELSALICLLDEYGDGLLINVVHTGELNHVFTKEIEKGVASSALSVDEKALLASM